MKILTEEELAMKINFRRPLHPAPEEPETSWRISFEYGANTKGTRISIPLAKQIAAELRASVAEAEKRELFRAFEAEKERVKNFEEKLSVSREETLTAQREVAELKYRFRHRKAKTKT